MLTQFAETDDPGTFKVWAIVGSDLHALKVNVPRIFYVNCHTAKEGTGASKIFHISGNLSEPTHRCLLDPSTPSGHFTILLCLMPDNFTPQWGRV